MTEFIAAATTNSSELFCEIIQNYYQFKLEVFIFVMPTFCRLFCIIVGMEVLVYWLLQLLIMAVYECWKTNLSTTCILWQWARTVYMRDEFNQSTHKNKRILLQNERKNLHFSLCNCCFELLSMCFINW